MPFREGTGATYFSANYEAGLFDSMNAGSEEASLAMVNALKEILPDREDVASKGLVDTIFTAVTSRLDPDQRRRMTQRMFNLGTSGQSVDPETKYLATAISQQEPRLAAEGNYHIRALDTLLCAARTCGFDGQQLEEIAEAIDSAEVAPTRSSWLPNQSELQVADYNQQHRLKASVALIFREPPFVEAYPSLPATLTLADQISDRLKSLLARLPFHKKS